MKIKTLFRQIKNNMAATAAFTRSFKKQPLDSLGHLLPIGMIGTSAIGFIVAIVIFILQGGYTAQVSAIKGNIIGGLEKSFTSGTASLLVEGIVPGIISILLIAELTILVISYFRTETTAKKIFISIFLGISVLILGFSGFVQTSGFGIFKLSEEAQTGIINILSLFDVSSTIPSSIFSTSSAFNGLIVLTLIGVLAFTAFIIMAFFSQHRWMIKDSAVALVVAFIVLPLALLLVENLVPFVVGIIALTIISGLLYVICKIFLNDDAETSISSGGRYSGNSHDRDEPRNGSNEERGPTVHNQKVIQDWSGPFWRDKGGDGVFLPTGDCVYTKKHLGRKNIRVHSLRL